MRDVQEKFQHPDYKSFDESISQQCWSDLANKTTTKQGMRDDAAYVSAQFGDLQIVSGSSAVVQAKQESDTTQDLVRFAKQNDEGRIVD